jgi:hypothetical protein
MPRVQIGPKNPDLAGVVLTRHGMIFGGQRRVILVQNSDPNLELGAKIKFTPTVCPKSPKSVKISPFFLTRMQITGTYVRYVIGFYFCIFPCQQSSTGLVGERGSWVVARVLITRRVVASRSTEALIPRPCQLVEMVRSFER